MKCFTILKYQHRRQTIQLIRRYSVAGSKDSLPITVSGHKGRKYCEIIDVRTPDEFSLDHIPGSINLPVLSNQQRVDIGTLYSTNHFEARKRGAVLISRNISEHLEKYFLSKSKEFSPLIYCWRGGQRSHSLGIILSQIGFKTFVLQGGYKSYRKHVLEKLKTSQDQFDYRVISESKENIVREVDNSDAGMTGSGKTHILQALKNRGEQVLDLEGLAKHKGSVLGLWHNETQPSQKLWESKLVDNLNQFVSHRPVWVESESKRIGSVTIPEHLFANIRQAPRFCINLPLQERVKHILHCYPNWAENTDQLKHILGISLTKVVGKRMVESWHRMIDNYKGEEFVSHILVNHYDPTYTHSQKKNNASGVVVDCDIPDLNDMTVDNLVCDLIRKGNQSMDSEHTLHLQH